MLGKPENPRPCLARGGITNSLIRISSRSAFPRIRRIVSRGYVSKAELRMLSATDFSNRTRLIMIAQLGGMGSLLCGYAALVFFGLIEVIQYWAGIGIQSVVSSFSPRNLRGDCQGVSNSLPRISFS